ncbi:MAG: DUF3256 family protein [Muribaculaceae bacterium]|nr:DUF3256 family protein [Muribaculaceae bacterium]
MIFKNIVKLIFASIIVVVSTSTAIAQVSPAKLFIDAPQSRFPFLSKMKRMDMVDYFTGGINRASENLLGGKSRILELTPDYIKVELVEGGITTTSLIPVTYGKDSLIVVVSNVATPAPDGMVSFYTIDWEQIDTKQFFVEPTFDEWLQKGVDKTLRNDLRDAIPFVMAEYSFDPQSKILTLKQTAEQYLPKADYDKVKNHMLSEIKYRWTGKKMVKIKS